MIRLTVISQSGEETILKVEGQVSGSNVVLLEEEGTRLFRETQRLVLDLTDVRFIDREGLAVLKRWAGDRLVLRGASLFLRTRLREHGLM